MKKAYHFSDLSEVKCQSCGKRLKKRIVEQTSKARNCYNCYSGARYRGYNQHQAANTRITPNMRFNRRALINARKQRRARLGK